MRKKMRYKIAGWLLLVPLAALGIVKVVDLLRGDRGEARSMLAQARAGVDAFEQGVPAEAAPAAGDWADDDDDPAEALPRPGPAAGDSVAPPAPLRHPEEALLPFLEHNILSQTDLEATGDLKPITAWCAIEAPPAAVWAVLTDYGRYDQWMPKCRKLRVIKTEGEYVYSEQELEAPGPNVHFYQVAKLSPPGTVREYIYEGHLKGGKLRWDLLPVAEAPGRTLVRYWSRVSTKDAGLLFQAVMNTDPSIDSAINLSTGVVRLEALKKRAEGGFARPRPYQEE